MTVPDLSRSLFLQVHLNTVTKDKESNIIQIASRGNYFTNFLTVDVSDDFIDIRCRNEAGTNPIKHNFNYNKSGRVLIQKVGNETTSSGWGALAFLDQSAPMLQFDFEEKLPLSSRPILGLGLIPGVPSSEYTPAMTSVPVNGIDCEKVLVNVGEFGQDYDAHTANVKLVQGIKGKAGKFAKDSRAAVWSMGPHFEGRDVAYALWFKTEARDSPILISYEGYWIKKTVMNLRLVNGRPELILSKNQKLRPTKNGVRLNDNQWHHLAVSNPTDGSMLSEIRMFVDGVEIDTLVIGDDEPVEFPNGGVISLGGFGHGRSSNPVERLNRHRFFGGDEFVGLLDEVYIFARAISEEEVGELHLKPVSPSPSTSPSKSSAPSSEPSFQPSSAPSTSPSTSPSTRISSAPSSEPSYII